MGVGMGIGSKSGFRHLEHKGITIFLQTSSQGTSQKENLGGKKLENRTQASLKLFRYVGKSQWCLVLQGKTWEILSLF